MTKTDWAALCPTKELKTLLKVALWPNQIDRDRNSMISILFSTYKTVNLSTAQYIAAAKILNVSFDQIFMNLIETFD